MEGMRRLYLGLTILIVAVVVTTIARWERTPEALVGSVAGAQLVTLESTGSFPFSEPPTVREETSGQPPVSARALYLVDVGSSYPLYGENEHEPVPIASVTKIMTALVALQHYQPDEVVAVSENAAATIGSTMNLVAGEEMTVSSLLHGLMITSGNDAAVALAEHMGYEQFIGTMNELAGELGLEQTEFHDPAGLDDAGRSTARDLGVLASFALRNDTVRHIASLSHASVADTSGSRVHELETSNRLIKHDHPLYLPDATGLKTGFTPEAGHCLVASATRDDHTLVSVVLGTTEQSVEASAKESRKLLSWGFDRYFWK